MRSIHLLADTVLWPASAASASERVDRLYLFLLAVAMFFSTLIFILIVVFAIKYRRRPDSPTIGAPIMGSLRLEMTWSIIPLIIVLFAFGWGANLYIENSRPPHEAMNVYVVGRQWMWKLQHSGGRQEINELHVPVGRRVRLTLASEDVIHSFFVPAFRVKQDAVPGRYTTMWFEPILAGSFHLFCAEYCGSGHSRMIGTVHVMEPADFQTWLGGQPATLSLIEQGRRHFERYGCRSCHSAESGPRGPALGGRFGSEARLQGGGMARIDDNYLRDAILKPSLQMTEGYAAIMPAYQGQISEQDLFAIIEYIKQMGSGE